MKEGGNGIPHYQDEDVIPKLKEYQYAEVMQRLDNLNRIDIDERFTNIEKQLAYFNMVCGQIMKSFDRGVNIKVDEEAMSVIKPLNETLKLMKNEAMELQKLRTELQTDSVLGSLAFLSKKLTELTQEVHTIKEEGLKKSIRLDLTMDGYEMVKKKPHKVDDSIPEQKIDPEQCVKELLSTLTDRERAVIIHRYGLFGEKEKTLVGTGKSLKISGERVREIQNKALRKMRHPSRKQLVKNITHADLRIDILGE